MTKFYDADKSSLEEAAKAIQFGFDWSSTPEGHDYWQTVSRKIFLLVEELAGKMPIRQEIAALRKRIADLESRL